MEKNVEAIRSEGGEETMHVLQEERKRKERKTEKHSIFLEKERRKNEYTPCIHGLYCSLTVQAF